MKHHTEICIIYSDTDMMCGLAYFHCLVVSWISFWNCHRHLRLKGLFRINIWFWSRHGRKSSSINTT